MDMSNAPNLVNYEDRLNRVTAYIYDHLDDEIDLNRLADVACLSPYHWHRVYRAVTGETIAATVKRLRLHRAAGYLAHTSMPVAEIAVRSGYTNLQSFTRIFSAAYGMPPGEYRKNGSHMRFQSPNETHRPDLHEVEIRELPDMTAGMVEHVGSYMNIGKAFETAFGWLGARGLIRPGLRSVAVYYDDPDAVAEEALCSAAGVLIDEDVAIEAPLTRKRVAGGPYAVLRYKGPYADMKGAYQWLYGEWLVKSGREAANVPVFEEYLNNPRDTAPADLLTDICLPLARQA